MAQIKVLDLCNSDSLSELSYEDAQKVNGGLLRGCRHWTYKNPGRKPYFVSGAGKCGLARLKSARHLKKLGLSGWEILAASLSTAEWH